MSGESLHARLPVPTGTTYYANGATGDVTNGGTSTILRSSGADGVTNGTNNLTSASAAWSSGVNPDVGQGIAILVGATWNYRKITAVGGAGTLTFNGATIAAGSGRSWRIGGPWKHPQDFVDKTSATSVSPAPGDICEVRAWFSTLFGAIDNATTTITLGSSPATLGLPTSGVLFSVQIESEADYAWGYDGSTDGTTNTLVAATTQAIPTDGSVVGKPVWIQNGAEPGTWEQRTVSSVTDGSHLVYSGAPIASGTGRFWHIHNVEVCTCTSYTTDGGGRAQLTVTRGSHSSFASAHADGVRVDIPYMGKRATSYSDTGARNVIQSAGTAGAPFMVQNFAGDFVYMFPNADTTIGTTAHETIVWRTGSRYWLWRRHPSGGLFSSERARVPSSGNVSCLYFATGAQDCEIEGMRGRFPQQGSVMLTEAASRCHKYGLLLQYPYIHLGFNHHTIYDQSTDCDTINCIAEGAAYGNAYQNNTSANGGVVAHNTLVQSRGTAAHGTAAVWHEGSAIGQRYKNNLIVDCRRGAYGNTAGAGSGSSFTHNLVRSSQIQDFENNPGGNTSLLDWGNVGNYSALGTGTNLNLTSDPLLRGRYTGDYHPLTGSPTYNAGDPAFTPPTDYEGTARAVGVATIGALVAPEEVPSGNTITRSRRPMVIA